MAVARVALIPAIPQAALALGRESYDRKQCVWLWVDFNDQNYGGYSPSEFDVLINQCNFFRLASSPALLESPVQWMVAPGQGPRVLGRLPA
jgi:hypothetical protein